jgi:hypothetical protein
MPWDSVDKPRDEDATEHRRWTRRLRWRGGRRTIDVKSIFKCEHEWTRYIATDTLGSWDLGDICKHCGKIEFGVRHDGRTRIMQGDRMGKA